jgi:FdhD protein
MSTIEWEIERAHQDGRREALSDRVVIEQPLEISVNGMPLVALMRLPGNDKELAVGFCITEKVIASADRIKLLKHCGELEKREAAGSDIGGMDTAVDRGDLVELEVEEAEGTGRFASTYVVRTGCGGADLKAMLQDFTGAIRSDLRVKAPVIHGLGDQLTARQEVFRGTGGTHGAAVFEASGEPVVTREDVGRHNALDKVVGACALSRVPLEEKIMFISGRVSYEMALKTIRAGCPVLVSLAAPTSLGLRIAEQAGLTVIGFAGARRFNIYTHAWRVEE